MKRCTVEHISQGSAATKFRCGERFYFTYSAVYLRIQQWKNYWNRSTFAKVIVKIEVAPFLWPIVYFLEIWGTCRPICLYSRGGASSTIQLPYVHRGPQKAVTFIFTTTLANVDRFQ